jgi:succinate dehydrogenase / fumarate reductase cytochrome b subunit
MQRPLSPFMFPIWYRFQITSAPRFSTGSPVSLWRWLDAARLVACRRGGGWRVVCGDACFHRFADRDAAVVSLIGRLLLSPVQRHPAPRLDAGYGFEIRQAYHSGYAVLAATALLTMLAWLFTKTCGPSL